MKVNHDPANVDLSSCVEGTLLLLRNNELAVYKMPQPEESVYKHIIECPYNVRRTYTDNGENISGTISRLDVVAILVATSTLNTQPTQPKKQTMTIDLTTIAPGTKVRNREGDVGTYLRCDNSDTYPHEVHFDDGTEWYTDGGFYCCGADQFDNVYEHSQDIVEILEAPSSQTTTEISLDSHSAIKQAIDLLGAENAALQKRIDTNRKAIQALGDILPHYQ